MSEQKDMRRLSSRWTWFCKVTVPILWVAFIGYFVLTPFLRGYTQGDWFFIGIVVVASVLFVSKPISMKYVILSGDDLLVGGYGKTIKIPLKDVERVWGDSPWGRWFRLVRFQTRVPTPFGTKIAFMPPNYLGISEPPIVQELTDLARKAKGLES